MTQRFRTLVAGLCLIGLFPLPAQAGRSCIAHEITVTELQSALTVAGEARHMLNAGRSHVALIARVGNDIAEYGLKYTHVGFARKRARDGEWIVVHQLNPCASAHSGLFVQGLGTFMLDDLFTHEVLIVTLDESLETNLEAILATDAPLRLYDPAYSMISYPGLPVKYQNSNEWLLELVALAQARRDGTLLQTREDAHRFFLAKGYSGSVIHVSPFRQALAGIAAANVRFDDHPASDRQEGRFETVSVRSVVDYLKHTGDAMRIRTIAGPYRRADKRTPYSEANVNSD